MDPEQIAEWQAFAERQNVLANELIKKGVPMITAITMGGDMASAERATDRVLAGERPQDVVNTIGSYARFEWAREYLPRNILMKRLPALWVSSDPDDTNPEYLSLWKEAFEKNRRQIITDGKPFPHSSNGYDSVTLHRGQIGEQLGISWTLSHDIAENFAITGGTRNRLEGGKVITRRIKRAYVLAYLSSRGEQEVIVDIDRL